MPLLRSETVKLIKDLLKPWVERDVVTAEEATLLTAQMKAIKSTGGIVEPVVPKLLDQDEVSQLLGMGKSQFRKLEKEGCFPFKRKTMGTSVKYRNIEVYHYIMAEES